MNYVDFSSFEIISYRNVKLRQYFSGSRIPYAPAIVLHNPYARDVGKGDGEKHCADHEKIRINYYSNNKEDCRQNGVQPVYFFRIMTAVENID